MYTRKHINHISLPTILHIIIVTICLIPLLPLYYYLINFNQISTKLRIVTGFIFFKFYSNEKT